MRSKSVPIVPILVSLLLALSQTAIHASMTRGEQPDEAESVFASPKIQTLIEQGIANYKHGRYKEAVELYEQAKQIGTTSSYQKATLALGLAGAYRSLGRYKEAEELFKTAINEAEQEDQKHLNKKVKKNKQRASDLVPLLMSDLSTLYLDQCRYPECEQILKSSIDLGIKKVGPNDQVLALPLNNLIKLYLRWGKLNEAREVLRQTLLLFNTPQVTQPMLYQYTLFNSAQILNMDGKYKDAEALYKKATAGSEAAVGFEHEYVAAILEPLGELYRKESRYTEAKKIFQRVRKIRAACFSKEHPEYGKALLDLALVYRDEGRYAKAQDLCQQATKIIEHALGQDNIEVAKCWITSASISRYQGHYAEAEDLAKRAQQLDTKILGADHPAVAHDMAELADILSDEGKIAEAETLLNQSLKISTDKLGSAHPDIASATHSLAGVYFAKKDYVKAEEQYRSALKITESCLGKTNTQAVLDLKSLAQLFIAQKKYDEAEPYLKRALETDGKLFGQKSAQTASDLEALANLYILQNKKEMAAPLLQQVKEISAALPGGAAVQQYAAASLSDSAHDTSVTDKWALVIGISNFKDPSIDLKYAAKDATDFRNFLIAKENFLPDHVQLLTDAGATKEKIISNLGDGWLGKHAQDDDLVLVYVSSHGSASQEELGVNFLVAQDTDKFKLVSTGLPMQWLTKIIQEQVHSKRVVLILDVCHSGSAGDESKKTSSSDDDEDDSTAQDSASKGLGRTARIDENGLKLGSGQVVLCSSLADQVSWESKNYANSVFTRRLIEALQSKGKDTTLRDAYEQLKSAVGAEVLSDRSAVQTPNLYSKNWSGGDPVLGVSPHK